MKNFSLENILTEKLSKISKNDIIAYLGVLFFSFLSFGQFAFDFAYNNDGIGRLISKDGVTLFKLKTYIAGFQKGRWAYPFFENLYNSITSLPFPITVISIFLFLLISIIIWKIFKITNVYQQIITGGLISSSPIFTHYFFYSGDAEVYATGMLLISISVLLFTSSKKINNGLGILLSVIGLACYPALFAYSTSLICLYALQLFFKKESLKDFFLETFKLLFLSFLSLIVYFVITKVTVALLGLKMVSYKNAESISPIELLKNLPEKLILTYYLFIDFFKRADFWVKSYFLISTLLLIFSVYKRNIKHIPVFITALIACIPLTFVMYLITFEHKAYQGFQFGFILIIALLHAPLINSNNKWIKNILFIIPVIILFTNIKTTNQIMVKYRLNCESSRLLSYSIINDIQKNPEFINTKRIAVIGHIIDNDNFKTSKYVPKTTVLNGMNYPAAFAGSNVWVKFRNQTYLQGFDFTYAETEETNEIETLFKDKNIPEYPKVGSIFSYKDLIVVNLGQK